MSGCSYEYNGYTSYQSLATDLVTLLTQNGFILMSPPSSTAQFQYTLEATSAVDPLNQATVLGSLNIPAQPWRIHIDASDGLSKTDAGKSPTDPGNIRIYVGTPIQLPDDGTVTIEYPGEYTTAASSFPRKSGELTCGYYGNITDGTDNTNFVNTLSIPFASKHWSNPTINNSELRNFVKTDKNADLQYEGDDSQIQYGGSDTDARPFSFRATISDHGIAVCIWEEGQDFWGNRFSWFVVQRPVDNVTGDTLVPTAATSRCPVFCVYSVGGGEPDTTKQPVITDTPITSTSEWNPQQFVNAAKIYRFTVREIDVNHPTIPILASIDTPNGRAVIDAKEQVSITEGNQYVISFMNGFTTPRYLYKQELDLITYCSADVIGANTEIKIMPYTKVTTGLEEVTYKAMMSNLPDNAGMRILMLTIGAGQGVDGTGTPLDPMHLHNLQADTLVSRVTTPV